MAFGPWIRVEREKAEIGLNEFAKLIGISPAYWSRIERAMEKAPRDELIVAACKQLGLDTDRAFVEARRFPPDMHKDMAKAITAYRKMRSRDR
jgi:HTH-type transcriptional regulator, competence development regulator